MKHLSLIITVMVFCLMTIYSGCGNGRDAWAAVRHVSKRIKIIRPSVVTENKVAKEKITALRKKTEEAKKSAVTKPTTKAITAKQPAAGVSFGGELPVAITPKSLFKGEQHLYSRKGRIDPFAPFLHKPEPRITGKGQVKLSARRVPMTPLERIAIGQLSLSAIIRLSNKKIALVQESSGKGYIIKPGTYIGINGGQVSMIKKNLVVIEEKSKNIFGKTETKKIVLKLKKQPGE